MLPRCILQELSGGRQGGIDSRSALCCPLLPKHFGTNRATPVHAVQYSGERYRLQGIAAYSRHQENTLQNCVAPKASINGAVRRRMPSTRATDSSGWVTADQLDEDALEVDDLDEAVLYQTPADVAEKLSAGQADTSRENPLQVWSQHSPYVLYWRA